MDKLKVSICCITYNHGRYLRDCLDGFLKQKATFGYEILIHDDASTDNTQEIIEEYSNRHPDIIKPILQKENHYSKGFCGRINAAFNFPRARGSYIAMCEGDDYWIDPLKLQKQVDFLESNQDCSICFHATLHQNEKYPERSGEHRPKYVPINHKFTIENVILGGGGFMATNSMVFRREGINNQPIWMKNAPVGDLPLMLFLASKGNIGYIDDVMSVYRVHSRGSWTSAMSDLRKRTAHHHGILKMWNDFNEWTDFKFNKTVKKKIMINKLDFFKFRMRVYQRKIYSYLVKRH